MLKLSRNDIERISRKVLMDYLQRTPEKPANIDPMDFAEKMCGIRFAFADISTAAPLLGITTFSDIAITVPRGNGMGRVYQLDGKVALIDQSLIQEDQIGRLNFTMMHEAAHQLLALLYPEEYNAKTCPIVCRLANEHCTRPITNWAEWQTNVLTSCLLLPRELVHKYMEHLGLGTRIKLLNRVFAPREYELFSEMATLLGVSKTALAIRLNQMKLIDRNDFYDPYALVDIYPDKGEVA